MYNVEVVCNVLSCNSVACGSYECEPFEIGGSFLGNFFYMHLCPGFLQENCS